MKQSEHEQLSAEDNQVEIIDLELPREREYGSSPVPGRLILQWQRKLNRKSFRRFMSVALLVLVALVVLLSVQSGSSLLRGLRDNLVALLLKPPQKQTQQQAAERAIKPSLVISPQEDGIACLMNASWSPDSKYMAFIGYQKGCWQDDTSSGSGLVVIHDALSGSVVDRIKPGAAIEAAFHEQFPDNHNKSIVFYNAVLWSPGGERLAILFTIEAPLPLPIDTSPTYAGVFLLDQGSGQTWVFLQERVNSSASLEWDLQPGKPIHTLTVSVNAAAVMGNFPVADRYEWGANGLLMPALFPAEKSSGPGPIGNPLGKGSFTIWQPGIALSSGQTPTEAQGGQQAYFWVTSFTAWSPDGRYLISNLELGTRLVLVGEPPPNHQTLSAFHVDTLPTLPVRDAALQHLVKTLTNGSLYWLAWHPKGQVLAQYDPGVDLDLFDCHTGYELASLQLPTSPVYQTTSYSFAKILRWSPDGKRLLLFDQQVGNVGIWDISL